MLSKINDTMKNSKRVEFEINLSRKQEKFKRMNTVYFKIKMLKIVEKFFM